MKRPFFYIASLIVSLLCSLPMRAQMNTDRLTAIGRNALYFEDYVLSIQYFNQVIRLKPYLAEPYLLRAIAKIQLQDYTGALGDCNLSLERNPFQHSGFYTRGYVYRQLGRYAEAEADFTQALHFAPETKTYLMLRADVRASQQHFDLAMEDVSFLLLREPKNPTLLFEKGVICLNSKDTLCALDAFTQTVEYDSQNASNWSALGVVNLYLGNDSTAMDALTHSINLGSKWAGDYMNRGVLYYRQHNYRAALADWDEAIKHSPADPQCYYNRGMLRAEVGDYNRALDDLNTAIDLNPEAVDMRYQRGVVLLRLQQWQEAISDFQALIDRYPYFLPSYYLMAQAQTALGEKKAAFRSRQTAYELEQKKDSLQNLTSHDSLPHTDVMTANTPNARRNIRKEFSTRMAQSGTEPTQNETAYTSNTRGSIQNKHVDVVNEKNVTLTYYVSATPSTKLYHYLLDEYNRQSKLPSALRFATQELSLTADMVNNHFEHISRITKQIEQHPSSYLYFARAVEEALVQDYASAIEDCTEALNHVPLNGKKTETVLYTFCRANWRYKLIEYQRANGEWQTTYQVRQAASQTEMDFDIMHRDYDYVIKLQPDFAYAYYNKANMLCAQKHFDAAIEQYTQAIEQQDDFAEAYFNRGLTYIYTEQTDKGIADLSKAGELGIYQAYNLITRFQ